MANNENLKRIQTVISGYGIDVAEGLMMIKAVFGWDWVVIPDDKTDRIIEFIRCNYRTRYKLFDPNMHKYLMEKSPEYKRDFEHEAMMNQGKPWELRIPK